MRINKFVALATGMSRRAADAAITSGRISVNGQQIQTGYILHDHDTVTLDGQTLIPPSKQTIMLHKPIGYVCSRLGQGSKTVYDLLPAELHHLRPVGRLDKDSSGLLLMTNDGDLANRLTHPRYQKEKVYEVRLDKALTPADLQRLQRGVLLSDGSSKLDVRGMSQETRGKEAKEAYGSSIMTHNSAYEIHMREGRNRQIRRTFEALGYKIIHLHRTQFGPYVLKNLDLGAFKPIEH